MTRRTIREAAAAAGEVFAEAGWPFRPEEGGKHSLLVVTLPDGSVFRFPLTGTPRCGTDSAKNIARFNARKLVRRSSPSLD